MNRTLTFLTIFILFLPASGYAEVVKGVYGVPSISSGKVDLVEMKRAGVNAVFVSPDRETIAAFKQSGFKVFVSVNVFGGKGAWKKYPDAIPVKADGTRLGSEPGYKGSGGVCPTHEKWRRDRLASIAGLVRKYGGSQGIDGIWLDFIRYPGQWETAETIINPKVQHSKDVALGSHSQHADAGYRIESGMTENNQSSCCRRIPDTCYCGRCLEKFAASEHAAGFKVNYSSYTQQVSSLIAKEFAYGWMQWKKENIHSFVAEARKIIDAEKRRELMLGIFAVPWKKGERNNAISFKLAQDIGRLSRLVDVVSPMAYHRMLGQSPQWVGDITRYFKLASRCRVWPIIQSMKVNWEEYGRVFDRVAESGVDGILVYKQDAIRGAMWREFTSFNPPENLIPNSDFVPPEGKLRPIGWRMKRAEHQAGKASRYMVVSSEKLPLRKGVVRDRKSFKSIGILSGNNRAGEWSSRLPACKPGKTYRFSAKIYRPGWENRIYPEISIWGETFLLNTSWRSKTFQPVDVLVKCPEKTMDNRFRFINNHTGYAFYMARPELKEYQAPSVGAGTSGHSPVFYEGVFPIGIYGANFENLDSIKASGLNTAIIGGSVDRLKQAVEKCHELGLKYMISIPRDPDQLVLYLEKIAAFIDPAKLSFYVNDEPGIHSFPVHAAEDIQALIKARFPGAATTMAVVRPQVSGKYAAATDFFMLDQYPVPYMPMTWLSDSMDRAAEDVGNKRLGSVIQAFGGPTRARNGWPRRPTRRELDCLTFLSVIHGSRAIFYYTFGAIGKTKEGRERLRWVAGRLNSVSPWLLEYNLPENAAVRMVSEIRTDPKGRPAIHCCLKRKGEQLMLLATNTIGNFTEAEFEVPGVNEGVWVEKFGKGEVPVIDGVVRVRFGPYQTKAFVISAD